MPNQNKPFGPKSRSPERDPAAPNVTDGGGAGLTPWTILQAAIKAVPALKYALGVLGIVSAITIIKVFGIDFRVAVFGIIASLEGKWYTRFGHASASDFELPLRQRFGLCSSDD